MPRKGSKIEFCDGQNQFKVPFIMYTDFESILEPIESPNPDPNQPYSQNVNHHVSTGWCVYSKFAYGEVKDPLRLYRGKDCMRNFVITSGRKLIGYITCFPENPWTL